MSRGPTSFQITYMYTLSFQNTKSVFKAQNQFSKHKISFQKYKISFQNTKSVFKNTKSVFKTQITARICKISFQIINSFNYTSVKLCFLLVMSSLFSVPPKLNICRCVFNKRHLHFLFYMEHNVIIILETILLVL